MDWPTIASLATAAGTLVLAVATYGSVRASRRSSRVAEQSLALNLRPVLVTSRVDDPPIEIMFGDGRYVKVAGATAAVEVEDDNLYFAIPLRNAGSGLAIIRSWRLSGERPGRRDPHAPLSEFRDHLEGQPTISQFGLTPHEDREEGRWLCQVSRHWHLDSEEPEQ